MLRTLGPIVLVLLLSPWSPVFAGVQENAVAIEQVKSLLSRYATQSHTQNPALYDLYSNRAVITARVEGLARPQTLVGLDLKQRMRGAVARRDRTMDASIFTDVVMERRGGRLIIQAKRYATNRCYWDSHFRLGLEQEGGHYRIVEESSYSNPQAHCGLATAQAGPSRATSSSLAAPAWPYAPPAIPLGLLDPRPTQPAPALASGNPLLLNAIPTQLGGTNTPPPLNLPSPAIPPPPLPSNLSPEQQMLVYMELAKRIAAQSSQPQDPSQGTPIPRNSAGAPASLQNGTPRIASQPDNGLPVTPP